MPLPFRASSRPSWVLNNAWGDYDFIKNRYFNGYIGQASGFDKFSMCTDGGGYNQIPYTPTANGIFYIGKLNQNRITNLGLFSERASTNYCYYSRDLTQSSSPYWTSNTNITAAKNAVGVDGVASAASTLTATGNTASIYQTVTPTQGAYTAAVNFGGINYATNDTITLTGGTGTEPVLKVTGQSAGVITSIAVNSQGALTAIPSNPVSQGSTSGSGSTATFNITWASFVFSAYVKRVTGTGAIYMTTNGGSTTYQIDGLINSTGYTWITGMAKTNGASTYQVGFQIATSGDAIAVDMCQFEPVQTANSGILTSPTGGMPTTPLPNTTTGVGASVRNNNTQYWGYNANYNAGENILNNVFSTGGPWGFVISFNGDCTNNVNHGPDVLASDMVCPAAVGGGGGSTLAIGATNSTNTGNNGRVLAGNSWNVVAITCNGKGTRGCLNGGAVTAYNTTSPTWLPNLNAGHTHFNIGNNGSGLVDTQLNGSMGRFTVFNRELLDCELTNYTDPAYGYGQF